MKKMSQNDYTNKPQLNFFADNNSLIPNEYFPGLIKYMGSKTKIIDYIIKGTNDVYNNGTVVDLFAGSGTLSGALRGQTPILSNDIQSYSEILSGAYLADVKMGDEDLNKFLNELSKQAEEHALRLQNLTRAYEVDYSKIDTLEEFRVAEELQRSIINLEFPKDSSYYLFTKNYSGTYWSLEQCAWIDAYRKIAESYKDNDLYYLIMASLMFAMSYNSQSTGHYAQYRVAENDKSMKDILIYRKKDIATFFNRKFKELISFSKEIPNNKSKEFVSMDYEECLNNIQEFSTIYADPPYAFVHYSRFYHALETLVKYDYPELTYKGRYRTDRHQSPFSIKTQVPTAFKKMFRLIKEKSSNLVLSYSDNGLISLDEIRELAEEEFGDKYDIEFRTLDYRHSRMGRTGEKNKDVSEALILVKLK